MKWEWQEEKKTARNVETEEVESKMRVYVKHQHTADMLRLKSWGIHLSWI